MPQKAYAYQKYVLRRRKYKTPSPKYTCADSRREMRIMFIERHINAVAPLPMTVSGRARSGTSLAQLHLY